MYDLEEQEQIDAFKAWWKDNGRLVVVVVVAAALAASGTATWRWYQRTQAEQAGQVYAALEKAARANDIKQVRDLAGQLMDKFGSTAYGSMAALVAAKANHEAGDAKSSEAQLQWALDHARDDDLEATARLRLAGVLLDQKRYDEALKLLEAKHPDAFDGLFADAKGDVLVAQGKSKEAKAAYTLALEKLPAGSYREVVQVKRDAVAGADK
jgi:predicted negative regulator of RcsB-dependent stress response